MNQQILNEGIEHLVSVEPNFKRFIPSQQIDFFLRPRGFNGICALVIEQQISVKAAQSIKNRVFNLMESVNAKNFLQLDRNLLREAGISRPKINYLAGVAEQEITGEFNFDDLETMSDEEARKSLVKMKGVGSWTADCYLMACLGRQDIWPVGDIGLQEGVRRLKDLKERPNVEDMTYLARKWCPFRSVAANLLWADYD
jgi:DNA-3-methyladenine glycosylase II